MPSITGFEASGPILPSPRTALPLETTATRFLPRSQFAGPVRILDDRLAGRRHARRIGEREIALVAERLGRLDLEFPGLGMRVIDQCCGFEIVGNVAGHGLRLSR